MAKAKRKTTEQITKDLTAAQVAEVEADEQITAAQAEYQRLLGEEAVGRAKAGASLLAKEQIANAEHLRDLAGARVAAVETALTEAQDRADALRAEALAAENASLTEKQDALAAQIDAALQALIALLAELDGVNEQGAEFWRERRGIAERLGLPIGVAWNVRSIAFGDGAQKPLAKVIEARHTQRYGYAFLQ